MAVDVADVLFVAGTKNLSGIKTEAYWCKKSDIATFPTLPAVPTTLGELVTIDDDFVFEDGKCWKKFYTTLEAGEIVSTREGPTDHGGWRNKATLAFPRNDSSGLGAAALSTNGEFVILVKEPATGYLRLIGNDYCTGARVMEGESKSGKQLTESKGVVITFYDVANEPACIYTGELQLEPSES